MPVNTFCQRCGSTAHVLRDCPEDQETERRIDLYHSGWDAHRAGQPRPDHPDQRAGWDARADSLKVRVVMPERPEGYYHAPPGAFD